MILVALASPAVYFFLGPQNRRQDAGATSARCIGQAEFPAPSISTRKSFSFTLCLYQIETPGKCFARAVL